MEDGLWLVVRNDEHQYSVWPAATPLPAGWTPIGEPRSREACLEYIESAWTDMRPRSLRERMTDRP